MVEMLHNPERCPWSLGIDLYKEYHDKEWGVPIYDDNKLFEYLILEGAQAGLSWLTILKKREGYRLLYDGFDPSIVAGYNDKKKAELLSDARIIRNRLKIEHSVSNAKAFIKVQQEYGSFSNYIWGFVNYKPIQNRLAITEQTPVRSELSDKISKDLKKKGFKYVGTTIVYAYMEAIGMVNDHALECFRYQAVEKLAESGGAIGCVSGNGLNSGRNSGMNRNRNNQ